jgi:hypothetical protein
VPTDIREKPKKFYKAIVSNWLRRNPVLNRAEVRKSGTGLHIILWLDSPVEFQNEGERRRWSAMVRGIQRILPTDPNCPGITALTRPIGSVNSKNKAAVCEVRKGEPIPAEDIIKLFEQIRLSPFRTIAEILYGTDRVTPCPNCGHEDSRLDVLDHIGLCYGNCGKVRIGQLLDGVYKRLKKEG